MMQTSNRPIGTCGCGRHYTVDCQTRPVLCDVCLDLPQKRGRPTVADKRRLRGVRANDAEWTAIKARAAAAGLGVADYVRRAALGTLP